MNEFVVTPGFGVFATLIIGAVAGWLAEKATGSDHGLLTNIVVGVVGSGVGVFLLSALGVIPVGGWLYTILVATLGAVVVLWLWRMVKGGG
ncbi:MAG: GlsB/YeaQ/YmgE family stress response membrane protein [Rhodoblastus sp.]|nr:MAG: GlsB/YeaQ/YmgE family stress response membrane protein [Rhodoblastus sp.]